MTGSNLWGDYAFTAKIQWLRGSNVMLLARYTDDSNYVACNFSEKNIRIEQRLNNEDILLTEVKNNFGIPKNDFEASIMVGGNKIQCLMNGSAVAYADTYLNPAPSIGGIAFKTWDPITNNSEVLIKKVDVEALERPIFVQKAVIISR